MTTELYRENTGVRILFGAALAASFVAMLLVFPAELNVQLGAVGFLALLGVVFCGWRKLDVFSPLAILAFSFYFYCFIGPLNLMLTDQIYFYSVDITSQFGRFFLLVLVSFAGTLAGWYTGRRKAAAPMLDYSETTCVTAGFTFCTLSLTSFVLYYLLSGSFVDRSRLLQDFEARTEVVTLGYLLQGLDLCLPGLVLFSTSGQRWVRRTGYLFGAVLLVVALTTGFRANLVKTAFPLFMMAYVRAGRRPSAKACLVVALCALLGFAGLGLLRSGTASLPDAIASGALFDRDVMLSDLNTIQALLLVLAKVPEQVDYLWGASLSYIPTHILPRSLYPDKGVAPEVQLVWDLTDKNAGFALPVFGLLYLNFGYAGAAGGMFLAGWVSSRFYSSYLSDVRNRRLQSYLVVFSLLTYLIFPRHSLVQVLTQTVYSFAPLVLIDMIQFSPQLAREWSRRSSPEPQAGGIR